MSEPGTEQKPSRRLWVFAAIGALALHAGGGALAFAHLKATDAGDTFGAQAIEVGLEMASPQVEPTDLPPGPDSEASEQKTKVNEAELPKDVPTETDNPDRVVTPNDSSKPKQDDAKTAAVDTSSPTDAVAAEATARQTLDDSLPKANVATAPNIGLGKDAQKLKATWEAKVSAYVQSHLRYPKDRDKTTIVTVILAFNRLGHVLSVGIDKSSGDRSFDEAAISTIHRSDPLPRPPSALTDEQFSYTLSMKFKPP
jgi:TonB family protein